MEQTLAIRCECGELRGRVLAPRSIATCRAVCYCADCQAFAHFLGRAPEILDEYGGSDVFQTSQGRVRITDGVQHLACVNLTSKGLLRWYARCCNTPIGNTSVSRRIPFIGRLRTCLDARDGDTVPVLAYVREEHASAPGAPRGGSMLRVIGRFSLVILSSLLRGDRRDSPFFRDPDWTPVAEPKWLTEDERRQLPPYSKKESG